MDENNFKLIEFKDRDIEIELYADFIKNHIFISQKIYSVGTSFNSLTNKNL